MISFYYYVIGLLLGSIMGYLLYPLLFGYLIKIVLKRYHYGHYHIVPPKHDHDV
jgi:hypothetical protein